MSGSIIVSGARTPVGKLSVALKDFSAMDLGGIAIREALAPSWTPAPLTQQPTSEVTEATLHTLRQLARRIHYLAAEIHDVARRIAAAVASTAPQLLELSGIGPDAAAALREHSKQSSQDRCPLANR